MMISLYYQYLHRQIVNFDTDDRQLTSLGHLYLKIKETQFDH